MVRDSLDFVDLRFRQKKSRTRMLLMVSFVLAFGVSMWFAGNRCSMGFVSLMVDDGALDAPG